MVLALVTHAIDPDGQHRQFNIVVVAPQRHSAPGARGFVSSKRAGPSAPSLEDLHHQPLPRNPPACSMLPQWRLALGHLAVPFVALFERRCCKDAGFFRARANRRAIRADVIVPRHFMGRTQSAFALFSRRSQLANEFFARMDRSTLQHRHRIFPCCTRYTGAT